jgi:2-succinyl-6-hydroxy-2,4-cyclohexadiene-1-carboxylate synthase
MAHHNAGVRIVLVPGFTQTPGSWDGVRAHLRGHEVRPVAVPSPTTFAGTAAEIGVAGGEGLYVGYSMGGRLCLRLALDDPARVRGLVLVSASPGIADPTERAQRRATDAKLAVELERDGVDAFLARWLAQPMFATVPADAPGRAERRTLGASHLAACLRILGTGAMEPLWDRLGELAPPVLLVTGTMDAKFDAVAREMLGRLPPPARHLRLPGGHAVPLEQPAALAETIHAFAAELS